MVGKKMGSLRLGRKIWIEFMARAKAGTVAIEQEVKNLEKKITNVIKVRVKENSINLKNEVQSM